jgi:hypothetical protein
MPDIHDTTIFSESGSVSDGRGSWFYPGPGNGQKPCQGDGAIRRGLIEFNVTSIPSGSIVTSVTRTLHLTQVVQNGGKQEPVSLFRLDQDWGEGTTSGRGKGTPANAGDATWTDALYDATNPVLWQSPAAGPLPGGNFEGAPQGIPSATTTVDGTATLQPRSVGRGPARIRSWSRMFRTESGAGPPTSTG